jgi:Protein of unknown function (DUF1449)
VSIVVLSELWPFALAIGLLLIVAVLEASALLIGASLSHWLDGAVADPGEPDGATAAALGWLHIGKVPLLILIVMFLTTFAVVGFATQFIAKEAVGHFMPPLISAGIAAAAGVCAMRIFGAALSKVVPKDETSAVSDASLVGRVGTIVIGVAKAGRPAEARIQDEYGTPHYVMVEPEAPNEAFTAGASVLLVRHLKGRHFHAIHNPKPGLL